MNNEDGVLEKLVEWIESGQVNMIDVESRCISGSTLLHTAVHFNYLEAVQVKFNFFIIFFLYI